MHSYTHTLWVFFFKAYISFVLASTKKTPVSKIEAGTLWHVCWTYDGDQGCAYVCALWTMEGLCVCVCIVDHGTKKGLVREGEQSCVHCGPWSKKKV